jgi:hypothetical protein
LSEIEGDHAGGQTEDDELKGRNDTYNNWNHQWVKLPVWNFDMLNSPVSGDEKWPAAVCWEWAKPGPEDELSS